LRKQTNKIEEKIFYLGFNNINNIDNVYIFGANLIGLAEILGQFVDEKKILGDHFMNMSIVL